MVIQKLPFFLLSSMEKSKNDATLLDNASHTSITELSPQLVSPGSRSIKAVITLMWPYSSATGYVSFLLSEYDFRLREMRGQVRVQFSGSSAKSVVKSGITSGDSVVLSMKGVQWVPGDTVISTPGCLIDYELRFGERLLLQKVGSNEIQQINIDYPAADEPHEFPASPSALERESTPNFSTATKDHDPFSGENYIFSSPAFVKRARTSYGSLFDPSFDPFVEEDGTMPGKGRKRTRMITIWGYQSRSPTPNEEYQETTRLSITQETTIKPTPPLMTDESVQTVEMESGHDADILAKIATKPSNPSQNVNLALTESSEEQLTANTQIIPNTGNVAAPPTKVTVLDPAENDIALPPEPPRHIPLPTDCLPQVSLLSMESPLPRHAKPKNSKFFTETKGNSSPEIPDIEHQVKHNFLRKRFHDHDNLLDVSSQVNVLDSATSSNLVPFQNREAIEEEVSPDKSIELQSKLDQSNSTLPLKSVFEPFKGNPTADRNMEYNDSADKSIPSQFSESTCISDFSVPKVEAQVHSGLGLPSDYSPDPRISPLNDRPESCLHSPRSSKYEHTNFPQLQTSYSSAEDINDDNNQISTNNHLEEQGNEFEPSRDHSRRQKEPSYEVEEEEEDDDDDEADQVIFEVESLSQISRGDEEPSSVEFDSGQDTDYPIYQEDSEDNVDDNDQESTYTEEDEHSSFQDDPMVIDLISSDDEPEEFDLLRPAVSDSTRFSPSFGQSGEDSQKNEIYEKDIMPGHERSKVEMNTYNYDQEKDAACQKARPGEAKKPGIHKYEHAENLQLKDQLKPERKLSEPEESTIDYESPKSAAQQQGKTQARFTESHICPRDSLNQENDTGMTGVISERVCSGSDNHDTKPTEFLDSDLQIHDNSQLPDIQAEYGPSIEIAMKFPQYQHSAPNTIDVKSNITQIVPDFPRQTVDAELNGLLSDTEKEKCAADINQFCSGTKKKTTIMKNKIIGSPEIQTSNKSQELKKPVEEEGNEFYEVFQVSEEHESNSKVSTMLTQKQAGTILEENCKMHPENSSDDIQKNSIEFGNKRLDCNNPKSPAQKYLLENIENVENEATKTKTIPETVNSNFINYSENQEQSSPVNKTSKSEGLEDLDTEFTGSPSFTNFSDSQEEVPLKGAFDENHQGDPDSPEPVTETPDLRRSQRKFKSANRIDPDRCLSTSHTDNPGDMAKCIPTGNETSIELRPACTGSPSKTRPPPANEKLRLVQTLRTELSEFTSLKLLRFHQRENLDVLAVVTTSTSPPQRAKGGPRDYYINFNITDPTIAPSCVTKVHIFRPYQEALPVIETGDGVLLRNFEFFMEGKGSCLKSKSQAGSSWVVFKDLGNPNMGGTPVEYGEVEKEYISQLKEWFACLDTVAKAKIVRANGNQVSMAKKAQAE